MKQSVNILARTALPGLLALSTAAHAVNECRVEYGYHTGTGINRQDKTETVFIDAGGSKAVNRSQMNYVKSLKDHQVKAILQGAATMTLGKNQVNPAVGFYLAPVTLKTLQCLTQSSAQQSGFATPQALVNALKTANTAAIEVAKQLQSTFNQTGAQVAGLLKAAGYSGAQIAGALNSAFNATADTIAQWLKAAGYTAAQVIASLKSGINATAQQAVSAVKTAFGLGQSNLAQVGTWLKNAGYTAEQVAAGLRAGFNATAAQVANVLKSLYNASAYQMAQWLKDSGYVIEQVADAFGLTGLDYAIVDIINALKSRFNASADRLVRTLKQIQKFITPQNCGAAGCRQPAEFLKAAGYAAGDVLKALRTHFNLGVQGSYDIARNIYGLSGQMLEQTLAFAGYTAQQIASVATSGTRAVGTVTRTIVSGVSGAVTGAVSQTMKLEFVIHGNSFRQCGIFPSGHTLYGLSGSVAGPLPMPNTNRPFLITLIGNAPLATATAISGWPSGTRYTIRERGPCYLVVEFTVPTSTRVGTTGNATVMSQRAAGPHFAWTVGPIPSAFTRAPATTAPTRSTPSARLLTLLNTPSLYKIGSATTLDDANNIYTALDPFNNSPHCQAVPEPSPSTAPNNMPRASRRTVTVPAISWGVRNNGNAAAQNLTVELVRNNSQILMQRTVTTLNPNQQANFTFQRPSSTTCVAKVGAGGGCYHCGQRSQGWNDNGIAVRIRQ